MRLMFKTLAAATLAAGAVSVQAQAIKWDFPTGYSPSSFQTQNVEQFAKDVERLTNGRLVMTVHSGASLYRANQIKRAVQSGEAQIGEFILSQHSNENPIFGLDSVPFLADSYAEAKRLSDVSRPALEKLLASQGMRLLFVSPWPGQSLYSKRPISSAADLKGTKMRTFNPATQQIATHFGAQPVQIQLAELNQAVATGIVDNFLTSSASGVETKLYESIKHFYTVNAWLPRNAIAVNEKAFSSLDKAIQDAVLRAARDAEARGWKISEEKNNEYLKELSAKGMTVAAPPAALSKDLKALGDIMLQDWIKAAGADGKAIIDAYLKK